MQLDKGHFYEFGPFRLNPGERLLLRENRPVALSPKGFELLVFLVTNHGRLLTKDQIFETVWAGSFVEESNLTVSISALRRALGEKDSDLQYIETVTKAGYRFIAPVRESNGASAASQETVVAAATSSGSEVLAAATTEESSPAAPTVAEEAISASGPSTVATSPVTVTPRPTGRRKVLLAVALSVVVLVLAGMAFRLFRKPVDTGTAHHPRSLAILPFQNLRRDPASNFLGFSLADAVITRMGYVGALAVRPSSAVEQYRDQVIDIQNVGTALKVDTLLTGNFVRDGDNLRINPQLIDVKSNRILWRGSIDVKYDNLLTVEDKVAQEIVKSLALNLTPSETERMIAHTPGNPLAYEYFLRGVDLYARNDFPMAIKMLEKSAEIDPSYALTWAQIGTSYTAQASFQFGGRDLYRKAQAAYERALALEPAQLETHIYMANLLTDTGRVEQAVPLLREALKTNPNSADLHWELGYAYRFGGMLHESVDECELARRIDPGVKLTTSAINGYLYLGQYDKFLQSLPETNGSAFILFYRGFGEFYKKNDDEAARDFDAAYELNPSLLHTNIGKALSYAIKGQKAKGIELLGAAEKKIQERGVGDPEAMYKLAQAYAVLGDKSSGVRMLRHSIESGFFPYPYFENDPLLKSLRDAPEFAELMSATRQRQETFKSKFF